MAEILDVYKPQFWAQETLLQLFPRLAMANLVHRDFASVVANAGDTVNTRIPDKFTVATVDPANFASQTPTATNVQVVMNAWRHVTFKIGDKENSLTMKRVYEEFLPNAAQAIAQDIEDYLMARYVDVYHRYGAVGTALNDVAKIGTDIKQKFDELNIPRAGRFVVLSPVAENYFNQIFYNASVSGSAAQQTTGELIRKFGMDYFGADRLPGHTVGTWDKAGTADAAAAGATTLVINAAGAENTTTVAGDLITIAHANTAINREYVVVTGGSTTAGNVNTVTIAPGLRAALAGGEAVTGLATPNGQCLAFHNQAFALVSRPLETPGFPGANVSVANYNGIGLRASVWYEPKDKASYVCLDILFGVKTLDARKAFRVIY